MGSVKGSVVELETARVYSEAEALRGLLADLRATVADLRATVETLREWSWRQRRVAQLRALVDDCSSDADRAAVRPFLERAERAA